MKRKIWIDCDPGIDDAVAIAVAAAHQEELDILGISAVAGNQTIERTTENALKLTSFLGAADIPVVSGSACPLTRTVVPAPSVHGATGLGDCRLLDTEKKMASEEGIAYMAKTLLALPKGEQATLVPMGPLTNIALLFRVFPRVKERIREICLMGGAAVGGNVTPTGEFNIWQDPEAAQIVFTFGIPIVMCGLDVTEQCGFRREDVKRMMESDSPVMRAYGEMEDFYFHSPIYSGRDVAAVHDAVTVTYLLHPEWFGGRRMHVEIDCSEGLNRGMTVCDQRHPAGEDDKVLVLLKADAERVRGFWLEALGSF